LIEDNEQVAQRVKEEIETLAKRGYRTVTEEDYERLQEL